MKRLNLFKFQCGGLLIAITLLVQAFALPGGVYAEEKTQGRVLKVAFPEVEGFSMTSEDGTRSGIVVDYLNEIAKYTGWEYEYIEVDSEVLFNEFLEGKYDLVGGTYYQPEFEKYFAYPDYNCGFSKSILLTRRNDDSIRAYDWKSMTGKTIGVYERAEENIRRLQDFMRTNEIDCTLKYYTKEQLDNGSLDSYLKSGEVDMLLGNSGDDSEELRIVAEFNSQPHYIVTTLDNKEVLEGLNMAMSRIVDSNPDYAEQIYTANFSDISKVSIFLNENEKKYIEQKQTVSVAVVKNWHPLFCMKTSGEIHNGVIPDILKEVEKFSGLKFIYKYAESYSEALELVKKGEADMLGAFLSTEAEGLEMGLAATQSYATLSDIIARNKSVSYPSEGLTGAVIEGRSMPGNMKADEVKYYPNATEALRAVNRAEVDFFYGLSPEMEQEIQKHHYTNVVPNTVINDRNHINFAVVKPAEPELLTLMNKAINSLSSATRETIINKNMISVGSSRISLVDMIYANPIMFVMIIACIFLLVVVLVLVVARSRVKSAEMQGNLEKAEADSRAKGEFLSRMSHEIRTPMNAIVGLSDLTCMIEGVPVKVRENLMKIRSSSHYLLSLISDILDMSRIESGMMTIDCEPFSMGRTADELKSMMAAEAGRRGLEFVVNHEIREDTLIGDAVRLKQVLTNLISNALKFTPAGGKVLVHIKEEECKDKMAIYCFRVIDNGAGISEENQKLIFEAFEQVGTNYSKSQGTGLGLSISKTLVELMGGQLMLESEPGKGSEFYFRVSFPVGEMEDEPEKVQGEYFLEGMNILLAEDNDLNAEIAIELLKMKGASVRRAENGKEAVDAYISSSPGELNAILMDIQMPVMDGLEACRTIRKMERPDAVDIPVIAMTANSFKEDEDAAAEAGMNGFVTKPVNVEELYHVLHNALKR